MGGHHDQIHLRIRGYSNDLLRRISHSANGPHSTTWKRLFGVLLKKSRAMRQDFIPLALRKKESNARRIPSARVFYDIENREMRSSLFENTVYERRRVTAPLGIIKREKNLF